MKEQLLLSYANGITRTPSDFLAGDGELADCVNLEVKGQELVPIEMPVDMGITLGTNEELIHIHRIKQVGRKNYITRTNNSGVYTIKSFYINNGNKVYYDLNTTMDGYVSCVSIGNTLVLYSNTHPLYIIFKNNIYKVLGHELPDISLSFNLTGVYKLEDEAYTINETGDNTSPYQITGSTEIHQSHVNKFIAEKATGENKFMYPFFVRYTLRLYNGQYIRYSAPILMLPSIYTSPDIHILKIDTTGGLKSVDFVVGGYVSDLQMKVNNLDDLSNWTDIIKGVSIFITRQTYSYDQNYVDNSEGKGNFLYESRSENAEGDYTGHTPSHIGKITSADTLDEYSMTLKSLPTGYKKWSSFDIYDNLKVETVGVPSYSENKFIGDLLESTSVFYKYLDINTSELLESSTEYISLSERFDPYPLSVLTQGERLNAMGDYMTNDVLVPSFANVYNSRLNIANIKRFLYKGYAPDSLCQNVNSISSGQRYSVYVHIHTEGGYDVVVKSDSIDMSNFDMYGAYLYYPDTDAYLMDIVTGSGSHISVPLTEDPYSNGSYYIDLGGIGFYTYQASFSETEVNYESLPNKMFTSEVNNPFYFPLAGINTVGTGEILGISALTRPISQGQFGEYPLMVFCDDGNFALKVDSEGYYSGISPMQEDIILGQDKLTPLENSILAITKKGILITGASSDLTRIATQLDGKNFISSSLPGIKDNVSTFSSLIENSSDEEGFREYLEGARMAYDYSSDRIFIYNKNKNYCYVYLFVNNTISKLVMNSGDGIITHVIDYPDSIVQTKSGKLYSLYEKEDVNTLSDRRIGFAVTRSLKFNGALLLKSIRQIKNLWYKVDSNSSVKYKLYGSNDNVNYYPLHSLLGKPYKYYRIAFFTDLLPKEAFAGTAIIVDERRNNKLR